MDLVQFFGRFHVLVLHLPIGILLMAAVMEARYSMRAATRPKLLDTLWLWGFVSAAAACILGYMLSLSAGYDPDAIAVHRTWGISVAVFSLFAWLVFRRNYRLAKTAVITVCSIQLFMLFSTGHYGANMTHGASYLFEHAPNTLRVLGGLPPREAPRPKILDIDTADVYLDIVKPALKTRCVTCHKPGKSKGKLDLTRYASLLQGGETGPAITAGNAQASELYRRITLDSHDEDYMPADGKTPLSAEQVAAIEWWITAGAPERGLVRELNPDREDKSLLARALGLEPAAGAWPLGPLPPLPDPLRVELESHGFLVKRIARDINHIDVDFSTSNRTLTDAALTSLVAAKDYIAWLNLSRSGISDQQLAAIGQLSNLLKLRLESNPVSSPGVRHLIALNKLHYLNLYATEVDDDVFASLQRLQALKSVFLTATNISPAGIAKFARQISGSIEITHDAALTHGTSSRVTRSTETTANPST